VGDVARRELEMIEAAVCAPATDRTEENKQLSRLVALGRALSDPIRVRMLGLMAAATVEGRGCCDLPDLGAPVSGGEDSLGICVCEFEDYFGMGQSKVSYHLGKLREAGLVREERRGKWSFYSLEGEIARQLLAEAADLLVVHTLQGSER
jgi:ArsR family transcriptional regulator